MASKPVSLNTSPAFPPTPLPPSDKTPPSSTSMLFTTSIRPSPFNPFNFTLLPVPFTTSIRASPFNFHSAPPVPWIRPSPFSFYSAPTVSWVENEVPKTTIFFSDLFTPVKKDNATERPPLLDFDVGADDELCAFTLTLPYSKNQFDEQHEEKPSVAHLNNAIGKRKRFLNSKKQGKEGVKKKKLAAEKTKMITNAQTKIKTEPLDAVDVPEMRDFLNSKKQGKEGAKKKKLAAEKTKMITNAQTKIKTEPLDAVDVPEIRDKWRIKKRLGTSDINRFCRLLLPRKQVIEYVLPLMDKSMIEECQQESGKEVIVWDVDTDSKHEIVFKQWKNGKTFVLVSNWKDDFVIRRNLGINDEVGLLWDQINSMFHFSVINKN